MKCSVCESGLTAAVLVNLTNGKGEALCAVCLDQLRQTMRKVRSEYRRAKTRG